MLLPFRLASFAGLERMDSGAERRCKLLAAKQTDSVATELRRPFIERRAKHVAP
ncbi:MAG: hypothetical protein FWH31_02055 [Streptococcaceae bacterium]|nr:hypothetical protein [Streptococcaceae bacterium]